MKQKTEPEFPNGRLMDVIMVKCPECIRYTAWNYQRRVEFENRDYDLYVCSGCDTQQTLQSIVEGTINE